MSQTEKEIILTQFWKKLKEYLLPHGFVPVAPKTEHKKNFVKFNKENPSAHTTKYNAWIFEGGIRAELCLDFWKNRPNDWRSNGLRKAFYENLLKHSKEIDEAFDGADSLSWDNPEKEDPSQLYKIKTPRQQCDPYNEAEWESIFESIKDLLERLDGAILAGFEKVDSEMSGSAPKKTSIVGGSVAFIVILLALYILFF